MWFATRGQSPNDWRRTADYDAAARLRGAGGGGVNGDELAQLVIAQRVGFYHCNACNFDFTIRTGTIFERSKVPLHKWVYAMYLLVTARKGISSMQLAKEIGVTQKTAWFILGRLREACSSPDNIPLPIAFAGA